MSGRSAATSAAATSVTALGSGATRSRGAGVYVQPSGTSSRMTSTGISTSTGRGRPFFTCVKARRIASGNIEARDVRDLVRARVHGPLACEVATKFRGKIRGVMLAATEEHKASFDGFAARKHDAPKLTTLAFKTEYGFLSQPDFVTGKTRRHIR